MSDSQKFTEQALSRLRAYAKGNGLTDQDIQLIETKESVHTVHAQLTLTPYCDVKSRSALGRMKGKAYKVLSSFNELTTEVEALRKDFLENAPWLDEATAELEKTSGHGWGQHGAFLCWSDKKTIIGATENCPTCRGTAQRPCPDCKGLGSAPCHYCESRGRELCIQCAGHGQDPTNPKNRCPMCNGTGYMLCRFCQGQTKLPCVTCQSRGNTPCIDCKGTGFLSQEVEITKGARMDFALGSTSGLPSGLLRGLSRVGDDKLAKGHADITMQPVLPDDPDEKKKAQSVIIKLEAKIPYADIKVKLGKKAVMISSFGKQGRLSGIPPFLDEALETAREHLGYATKGNGDLGQALSARAMKDAFNLVLAGKTHPNELRRLYPVGLSGDTAQEIMGNFALYLRKSTTKMRMFAAAGCLLLSSALFGFIYFTSLFTSLTQNMAAPFRHGVKLGFLLATLAGCWLIINLVTTSSLRKQFTGASIASSQTLGKTGYGTLGIIALLYVLVLFLSGNLI